MPWAYKGTKDKFDEAMFGEGKGQAYIWEEKHFNLNC